MGFEPTTSGFEVQRSIQLNYECILYLLFYTKKTTENQLLNGAGSGNRTHLASLEGWSITDIRYLHINLLLERETGLEPATSTLARWHSTIESLTRLNGADEGSRTPTP